MDEAIAADLRTTLPSALAEPTVPVRRGWITLLFLANIGLWLAVYIAYHLPLVVAPLLAGALLGLMNSYPALFALAGVVTVMAAWTVGRVRSVP